RFGYAGAPNEICRSKCGALEVKIKVGGSCLIANLAVCTGLGFLLTSLKLPHYGVIANLVGQVFWLYSSYRAWREADQIGIFISTICITLILAYGVTNYWLFGETFSVKKLVAMVEPARNSCLALVLQHSHIASCLLRSP